MIVEFNSNHFGENIRKLRILHKISLQVLASQIGISEASLERIESGSLPVILSADTLRLLSKMFSLPVEMLMEPLF
jgi:transcriptional regulator with XRE-family HTH domain